MRQGAGVLVFARDTGRYLFLRRVDDGLWDFPGGLVDPLEKPEPAMIRELEEETGYAGEILEYREPFVVYRRPSGHTAHYVLDPAPADAELQYYVFHASVANEFMPQLDGEHDDWTWILDPAELSEDWLHPGTDLVVDVVFR